MSNRRRDIARRRAVALLVSGGIVATVGATLRWWLPALPSLFAFMEANSALIGGFADLATISTTLALVVGFVLALLGYRRWPGSDREAGEQVRQTVNVGPGGRGAAVGGDVHGNVVTGDRYELHFGSELVERVTGARAARSTLGMLPSMPETFVGRTAELADLKGRLGAASEGETPTPVQVLTAVQGWPGVGKTTVAAALARDQEVREMFPDGVVFTSLGHEPEILSTLVAWSRALGLGDLSDAASLQEASTRLSAAMREKRVLLIIDDVWEASHASSLAVGGRRCGTLITTRLSQVAHEISPRAEGIYRLRVLSEEKGLELLEQLAPDVVSQHPEESLQLVRELDGLPLAIRVAGGLLAAESHRGLDVQELLEELRDGKRLLEAQAPPSSVSGDEQEVPLTVTALLRRSTVRLRDLYRERFAMLGVFPARPVSFDTFAAQAVWNMNSDPRMTLRSLTDRGLIEPAGNGRFQMHSLLSAFAMSLIEEDNELPSVREVQLRRAKHYEEKIVVLNETYKQGGDQQRRALEEFDRDYESIRAAHNWAVVRMKDDREAARVVNDYALAGSNILLMRMPPREMLRWYTEGIEAAGIIQNPEDEKTHKANLGAAHAMLGEPRRALPYFEQALRDARDARDPLAEVAALGNIGRAYYSFGDYDKAIEYTEQARELARTTGEWRSESQALGTLGESYAARGETPEAVRCLKDSWNISRRNEDSYIEARALRKLGVCYRELGNTWRAGVLLDAAASAFDRLPDELESNRTLLSLGILCTNEDSHEKAIEYFDRVESWARANDDEGSLSVALMNKGNVLSALGQNDQAETLYRHAISAASNAEEVETEADASYNLAGLIAMTDFAEAVTLARTARSFYEELGSPKQEMVTSWLRERGVRD